MLLGRGLFDCPWSFMLELSVLSHSGICIYSQFQMKQCTDFSTDIKHLWYRRGKISWYTTESLEV